MDFVFGFLADSHKTTGILVFVDRFSKMVHLVAVPESINASAFACVSIETVFRLHGLPRELVSDRDPRFTTDFCRYVFITLGTRLKMCGETNLRKFGLIDGLVDRKRRLFFEKNRLAVKLCNIEIEYQGTKLKCQDTRFENIQGDQC